MWEQYDDLIHKLITYHDQNLSNDDSSKLPTSLYPSWDMDKCNAIIPHYNADPNFTLGISLAVITVLLAAFGIYKGFFANKNLADPWDDHDD
ncbi:MAG: hypothetical protein CM15mV4_2420 [Caudoviricetes sp.]|nr:MAG: hypothetical protein CM15mV4_2420 [Caudoviricetes sp.]